jgi:indolepyruvate ferredoxin oxidoreductase alpha subunit
MNIFSKNINIDKGGIKMKKMGDMLLRNENFSEIVIGNTAIVRAMIEAGTEIVTSYPGSPTPEIATAISSIKSEKRPFYFEFSTNEKVATEVSFGASVNGHLSTVFFKSVGLNVAADSFVQLALLELIGGMVIILGDDPGANSSQNEQDNRHYAEMTYIPVLEPSTPQEAYEMYIEATKISKKMKMPVILRLTTHVCHAKQKVHFKKYEIKNISKQSKFDKKNGPYIPITSEVFNMKKNALLKLNEFKKLTSEKNINKLFNNNSKKGIITMGVPYLSLLDVLEEVEDKPDILKLGVVYPLEEGIIKSFLNSHDEIKILEELDDILETNIKRIAYDNKIYTKIMGKFDINEFIGEYTPDKVQEIMNNTWPEIFQSININKKINVPKRPAQMCPGCGHRSAFYAIKKALNSEDITVADIGCHTLGYLPPYEMGEVLLSMGHSISTGSGLSLFNEKRNIVSFLGDSTFFHAAIPGIINAVFNKHNLTLIIMENGTTAMTGHQDHPAVGSNFNEKTKEIPLKKVLEGIGVENIFEVDAYSQNKLFEIIKKTSKIKGLKVVIVKHPCMLKFTREQRKKGTYKNRHVFIDQNICNNSNYCIEDFACPSFQKDDKGNIWVHEDLCIGDGSCIQTCPTSAIKPKNN